MHTPTATSATNKTLSARTIRTIAAGLIGLAATSAVADNWTVAMTVDNQFDAYKGTVGATVGAAVGSGSSWSTTYNFSLTGMTASDYFYVSTASDHSVAQGFLGEFNNTTLNYKFNTGGPQWEVFPVGKYLQLIDSSWPAVWPSSQMPTQGEVDQALAWAVSNPSVWITPAEETNWDNRASGNVTIWGTRPGIDNNAEWIWNDARGTGNPLFGGYNHDEFLIFRVPGVPAPATAGLLGLAGLGAMRRRR
ncbi:MAG: PEP-CTERM sorting domain-containing protein [Phycisphaerales bacterium JB054]